MGVGTGVAVGLGVGVGLADLEKRIGACSTGPPGLAGMSSAMIPPYPLV